MTKIKVCGLFRDEDIDMVNEVLPDYAGFVFAKSKRQIEEDTAMEFRNRMNSDIKSVGVFVNDSLERILKICKAGMIDLIQLHGDEDECYIQNLKSQTDKPVIKAVRVRHQSDIILADTLSCDYLLLDAYREDQYGGCGETFDWTVIEQIRHPYFLAGGINQSNVAQAISSADPYCIDVSSGVETDGYKDRIKMKEIVQKVRSVE